MARPQALSWLKDYGIAATGEAVEALVSFRARYGGVVANRALFADMVAWMQCTPAGTALWRTFEAAAPSAAGMEGAGLGMTWRSKGVVVDGKGMDVMNAPLEDVRKSVARSPELCCGDYVGAQGQRECAEAYREVHRKPIERHIGGLSVALAEPSQLAFFCARACASRRFKPRCVFASVTDRTSARVVRIAALVWRGWVGFWKGRAETMGGWGGPMRCGTLGSMHR